ncbi:TetR/AcrR family transcriptional regulator [Labrys okinawensis]|nr:TetR/AcrR family transcriptional regulator [Labrys okinawensis]
MQQRRRGADLERAILEAAWFELVERGYAGLTMEAVAERAGTSRPVLGRRWNGKAPLVVAAIRQQMAKNPIIVPDRGDLRTELLEFLDRASERTSAIVATFSLLSSAYFTETTSTPKELRASLIKGGHGQMLPTILERAVTRGEVDREKLVPPLDSLLSDLFGGHILMTFSAPPPTLWQAWVDSVFLPLVRAK